MTAIARIGEYVGNHPSLVYVLATLDDPARVLMEKVTPAFGSRIPAPLVLIEGQALARPHKQSAA